MAKDVKLTAVCRQALKALEDGLAVVPIWGATSSMSCQNSSR
jgi:hypothetical protein